MKTLIKFLSIFFVGLPLMAQQNAQFNQYYFSGLIINPAYAGTKEVISLNGIFSTQWTGLKGAPSTQTISVDGAVTEHIGLGLHFSNDMIGAQMQQSIFGSYAYKINLGKKVRLSLGLAIGASYLTLDGSKLNPGGDMDPSVPQNSQSSLKFDSKTGIFLYGEKFYAGFSVSDLLGDLIKSKNVLVTNQARHYYLTAGYVVDMGKKVKFKPSFLWKEDFRSPTTFDISAMFLFLDRFWLGSSVRLGASIFNAQHLDNSLRNRNAMVFMADWNITDRFRMGYAYTLTMTSLKDYGGHEIHLGYFIPTRTTPMYKVPGYF